jgi:hypothetical protein
MDFTPEEIEQAKLMERQLMYYTFGPKGLVRREPLVADELCMFMSYQDFCVLFIIFQPAMLSMRNN